VRHFNLKYRAVGSDQQLCRSRAPAGLGQRNDRGRQAFSIIGDPPQRRVDAAGNS